MDKNGEETFQFFYTMELEIIIVKKKMANSQCIAGGNIFFLNFVGRYSMFFFSSIRCC